MEANRSKGDGGRGNDTAVGQRDASAAPAPRCDHPELIVAIAGQSGARVTYASLDTVWFRRVSRFTADEGEMRGLYRSSREPPLYARQLTALHRGEIRFVRFGAHQSVGSR